MQKGVKDKFGVDNVSSLESIKRKKSETTIKNYGVENPSQCPEIFEKAQKSGKKIKKHNCGINYRGTYEKHFLDMCFEKNINVEKGLTIKYEFENKNKFYHSDFYLKEKNLIIEIKSDYYFNKFKNMNLMKKKFTIKSGFNYILILNKDYDEFSELYV
jgi:hypothetical protein